MISSFLLLRQDQTLNNRSYMRKCFGGINLCQIQIIFPALILSQVGDRNDGTRWAIVILVALVVFFRLASYFLSKRRISSQGSNKGYGYLGGTVCPSCDRPFAIHLWSLRLMVSRYDRCPHCKKWSFVNRQSAEVLTAAENQITRSDIARAERHSEKIEEADNYRRKLEDSRFDEG